MQSLTNPGDTISHTVGRITITLQYVRDNAYTVTTEQGGTYRIQELCTAHRDERTARARARSIASALKDGVSVEQLIGDMRAAQTGVLAEVARIVDTVPAGAHRAVRPTMAGAHLADITPPQRRALRHAANHNGRVYGHDGFARPVLRALIRKGLGEPVYGGRRHEIVGLVLTGHGRREALAAA